MNADETGRLLESARAGDRSALDALCARHQARLLLFLRSRMPPILALRVDAEDLLQETLVTAMSRLAAFEPRGPTSFYRWLVGIGRFKIAESERAWATRKRAPATSLEAEPGTVLRSPSGHVLAQERADAILAALGNLLPDRAEAVRLRYLEGLGVKEVAEVLGRTDAAVKALVSRGLADLAARLDDV